MAVPEYQKKAAAKYAKAKCAQYALKLVRTRDADIIAKLEEVPNVQGYLKELIRKDINS